MKSRVMLLLVMIWFLLVAGRSRARLLENDLFIFPDGPSAFDPVIDDGSRLHTAEGHEEKDAVRCDEEIRSPRSSSSAKSATNKNTLSFRFQLNVQKTKKPQSPVSPDKTDGGLNLLRKGTGTACGASPKVNSMQITEQRLSKYVRSPGVGHMQMIHHKSQTRKVGILKSHQSNGDDKSNKRKLGSTPSPGAGH